MAVSWVPWAVAEVHADGALDYRVVVTGSLVLVPFSPSMSLAARGGGRAGRRVDDASTGSIDRISRANYTRAVSTA